MEIWSTDFSRDLLTPPDPSLSPFILMYALAHIGCAEVLALEVEGTHGGAALISEMACGS